MQESSGKSRSVWMREPVVDCAPLEGDARVEVCIVGAGLAGLSCAYRLAKEGRSVLVLDERGVGSGETGRTTAHLSNALDDRFQVLERVFGLEGSRLAAESHAAAIDEIESIVRAISRGSTDTCSAVETNGVERFWCVSSRLRTERASRTSSCRRNLLCRISSRGPFCAFLARLSFIP
jgi:glycine/D-amino acid oxidase-like deaminating enzyme